MCVHFRSRLYGIRVCTEHKRCQDKKQKGQTGIPIFLNLFLMVRSLFGTNFVRSPLFLNVSRKNNKNSGPLPSKYALCLMLFKRFNSFKSFKCFKGATRPRHTYVPEFKGKGL